MRAATESWKFVAENTQSGGILPLEHFIIHSAKMCEFAFSGEKITPETTAKRLEEINAIVQVLANHAHSVNTSRRQEA